MSGNLDLLKALFPRRVVLSVEEVASILAVGDRQGSYEHTRRELKEGRIIPGLRKHGGMWRVPLVEVAKALDRMVEVVPASPVGRQPSPTQSASPTTDNYGHRGRKPDSRTSFVAEYFAAHALRMITLPLLTDAGITETDSSQAEHSHRAKRRIDLQRQRAGQFWDEVSALLQHALLTESLPARHANR